MEKAIGNNRLDSAGIIHLGEQGDHLLETTLSMSNGIHKIPARLLSVGQFKYSGIVLQMHPSEEESLVSVHRTGLGPKWLLF